MKTRVPAAHLFFLALGALSLTASSAKAAEFEIIDRLKVGGSSVLVGSVTVIGSTLTVTGKNASGYSLGLSSGIYTPNGTVVAAMFAGDGSRLSNAGGSITDASKVLKTGDNMTGFLNIQTASMTVAYNINASSAQFGAAANITTITASGSIQMAAGSTITTNGGTLIITTNTVAAGSNLAQFILNSDGNIGFNSDLQEINRGGAQGHVITLTGNTFGTGSYYLVTLRSLRPDSATNSLNFRLNAANLSTGSLANIDLRSSLTGATNTGAIAFNTAILGIVKERVRLDNGRMGIGDFSAIMPAYTLDVEGDIRSTGSVRYGGSGGTANGVAYTKPDFVFEPGYKPLEIDEVERFLKKEGHLPWLTSAKKEKVENGKPVVNMTRMDFQTVETAENLQLQNIKLNRMLKELQAADKKEQTHLDQLEKEIQKVPPIVVRDE